MKKPPRAIGIPRCTCKTLDDDVTTIDPDFDSEGNCNYHDRSSTDSITWVEANLWDTLTGLKK